MKNLLALVVAVAFAAGSAGFAVAQTAAPAPAGKKAEAKTAPQPAHKRIAVKSANGTVKSATTDTVVVASKERKKGHEEVEWTFAVDAKTAIKKGGKSIVAADLKAGDLVHVRYMDMDGKAVAKSISARSAAISKKEGKASDAGAKPAEKPAEKK